MKQLIAIRVRTTRTRAEYIRRGYARDNITDAIKLLRAARTLLVAADAPKAAAKVRRALKSVEGAERNALVRRYRLLSLR